MLRKKLMPPTLGRLIPLALAALLPGNASAQTPPDAKVLGGEQRRQLMLQQIRERQWQNKLDNAYKAATSKIPEQKLNDPWGDVRPAPTVPAPKKKNQ